MIGFDEKLAAGAAETQREGLVWKGDPALEAYLQRRYPRRSGGGSIGFHRTATYEQGRRAGQGIVLHRAVGHAPCPARAPADRPALSDVFACHPTRPAAIIADRRSRRSCRGRRHT